MAWKVNRREKSEHMEVANRWICDICETILFDVVYIIDDVTEIGFRFAIKMYLDSINIDNETDNNKNKEK